MRGWGRVSDAFVATSEGQAYEVGPNGAAEGGAEPNEGDLGAEVTVLSISDVCEKMSKGQRKFGGKTANETYKERRN